MKKILLLTTAAAMFASTTSFASEGQFYAKGHLGLSKMTDTKTTNKNKTTGVVTTTGKMKMKNALLLGIGAGYYLTDGIRVEGTFDYTPNGKISGSYKEGDPERTMQPSMKGKRSTFMVNSYVDLFDANAITMFAGAGLGVTQVKAKKTASVDGVAVPAVTETAKSKATFTYALYLGATTEVADSLHADLTYSWKDSGKIKTTMKKVNDNGQHEISSVPTKGHYLTLGLRYDI